MLALNNPIQHYAWGSTRALARLQGRLPSDQVDAELWMGAHPRAPSKVTVDGQVMGLDEAIARWPQPMMGGPQPLPFLLKVLAVAAPLSVQTHPDTATAQAGYAREDAAGIPRDAPQRSYRDRRAKPELVVALSPFRALCGWRPWEEASHLLGALGLPWTDRQRAVSALVSPDDASSSARRRLIDGALARVPDALPSLAPLIADLENHYPGDPGVLFPLLLRPVTLQPGQALFLAAGQLHCYLEGVAVEIMGNSDNVLRGGLTPKHKDPAALLDVVDWDAPAPLPIDQDDSGAWPAPTPAFRLTGAIGPVCGPAIVLCTGGTLFLGVHRLLSGDSAFVPAASKPLPLGGAGVGFVASPG
ncbi:MAG: mannose-6-phosphate isomerase, class I, partial [Oligoflexia bacterium]|nr:mannose-6-phosphate isomerase, class I [Oligoflexia bacterium]